MTKFRPMRCKRKGWILENLFKKRADSVSLCPFTFPPFQQPSCDHRDHEDESHVPKVMKQKDRKILEFVDHRC